MLDIGFLAYGRSPSAIWPGARIRALAAEALLQSARIHMFASGDCDPLRCRIAAETWDGGRFIRQEIGMPSIVIAANLPVHDNDRERVAWLGHLPFVADPGPDKLDTAQWLLASPLACHVIPFRILPATGTAAALTEWLEANGGSVVKTAEGKRGAGLHFADRDSDGTWTLRHDGTAWRGSLPAVVTELCRRIGGRMRYRRYLVQRLIRSVTPDGRAVDLRVHVQRDATGRWGVTRSYARLGEYGLPVSNTSRGGYQGEATSFLAHRRPDSAGHIIDALHRLALGVAAVMEAAAGTTISELGVDVAIDPDDRLWVIEANTYPGTSLHEQDRAIRTIGYACHLARGGVVP